MSAIAFLRQLLDDGLDLAAAMTAADRFEQRARAAETARILERREKDAERKRVQRERECHAESRGQDVTPRDSDGPAPHVGERPQVVIPFSSSLRSEEVTSEAKASSVNASKPADPVKPKPKPPKSERGTRLSPDWEPSAEEFEMGREAGLTDEEIQHAALEFRNYWCARSRDAAKLSWRLTWHNRVLDVGKRKRERGPRLAASAGQSGSGRRGSGSFADIYARRHGYAED